MSEANQVGWMSLGIDVAKAKFDVAFLHPEKLTRRTFTMDATGFAALASWVRCTRQLDAPARGRAGPCVPGSHGRVRGSLGAVPL